MRRKNTGSSDLIGRLEQVAVLAASLVWTAVILLIIGLIWAHHDAQARWETVRSQRAPTPIALKPLSRVTPAGNWLSFATPPRLTSSPMVTPARTSLSIPTTPAPTSQPVQLLPDTAAEGQPPFLSLADEQPPVAVTALPTDVPSVTATISPLLLPSATPLGQAPAIATPAPPPPASEGPTRLVIASVGIDTPVIPVGSSVAEENGQRYVVWDVADYAAGWHNSSAPPGQPGNTVLAGHNNIKGEVFRNLVDVQEGDEVDLYVGETVYRYYVEQNLLLKDKGEPLEVRLRNAQWIAPTQDVRVTLVTCWPYTSNTHRVIVVAKPRPL